MFTETYDGEYVMMQHGSAPERFGTNLRQVFVTLTSTVLSVLVRIAQPDCVMYFNSSRSESHKMNSLIDGGLGRIATLHHKCMI